MSGGGLKLLQAVMFGLVSAEPGQRPKLARRHRREGALSQGQRLDPAYSKTVPVNSPTSKFP